MGAQDFVTVAQGKTAREAFQAAQRDARFEHGNGGYTGTIAEKPGFTVISEKALGLDAARAKAQELIGDESDRAGVCDKWGSCAALRVDADTWLFAGYASS